MIATRHVLGLLASVAITTAAAIAGPIGGVMGAGAHAGMQVPPVSLPHPVIPPVAAPQQVPPVTVPAKTTTKANANTNARANANVPLHGTLTAISGTSVTVRLSNGTTQNYNVSAQTAGDLRAYINKPIEFRLVNGMLTTTGRESAGIMRGTISAVNGTSVAIRLTNGTTETINASAQTATRLRSFIGKNVAFRVTDGMFTFAGAQGGNVPIRGKLTAVSGNSITVQLPGGSTQTYTVSSSNRARFSSRVGHTIVFWINADGSVRLNQSQSNPPRHRR